MKKGNKIRMCKTRFETLEHVSPQILRFDSPQCQFGWVI